MEITTDDFGLEWRRKDKILHKADYDELINAYEKLEKIKQILSRKHLCSYCEIGLARCDNNCLKSDREEIKQIIFS